MTDHSSFGDGPGAQARTPAERTASAEPAAGGSERRAGPSPEDLDELAYRITAIREHPVTQYVRELPFESAVYPANMYRGFAEGKEQPYRAGLITWCPPGHDYERPKRNGCGFIREKGSRGDGGIRYTACSEDDRHYAKGRRSHCWSLHCPVCMNDTALRTGSRIEEQLNSYLRLMEKQGRDPGELGHWVISPPQEECKQWIQTIDSYNGLRKYIEKCLMDVGARAGCLAFHPWRQADYYWEFSPHFHSLLFGFLDTDRFRKMNPGWIIKKVHADQALESIGQTAAYLMTHVGLGMVERDPLEVDYDLRFLSYMLPGLSDDGNRNGKADEREFRFSEQDDIDRASGKGRMVGDISKIDWVEFAKRPLGYTVRFTYFGLASNKSIQTVAVEREYRTRECRTCGKPLSVYAGICDGCGEPARFLYENTIRVFRNDRDIVKRALDELRNADPENMPKLSEIAPKVSLMVSRNETSFNIPNYYTRIE